MPRAAPLRYDPLAVREPVPHQRDTRLARRQRPRLTIQSLPRDVLAIILAMVPWQTARGVCRRWAALRPMPFQDYVRHEADRTLARVARVVLTCAMEQIVNALEQTKTRTLVEHKRCYSLLRQALARDVSHGYDLGALLEALPIALLHCVDYPRPDYYIAAVSCGRLSIHLDRLLDDDDHWVLRTAAATSLDAADAKILRALELEPIPSTFLSYYDRLGEISAPCDDADETVWPAEDDAALLGALAAALDKRPGQEPRFVAQ